MTISAESKIPQRILKAIEQQQERSEILISVVQLFVVTVFGLLYAISPKTFTDEAAFAPVPWVLGAYLLFSLLRLTLAVRRKLPDSVLYLSAVADIALLLGLIWSFHIQYEQPASFYLKAPTLLYVFIFIALRALRFDPRFVIASGVSAALGWMIMVAYVMFSDAEDDMVTRDYIQYMTSNSVLIGAEFDKILSILIVTAVLAVALMRAQKLLIDSVRDSSAVRDLAHFVPDEVAKQVIHSEEGATAGRGEVAETTILFTDIEGFTSICESLPPEQLIEALNEYFSLIAQPIEEFGGVISQFQGDAVLATFHVPRAHPEHAANAIRAALKMQSILQGKVFVGGSPFRTRIGINTGPVVGGLVGSGDRVGYTVHGDNVNLTARLEQLNKDYNTRIIVSENTVTLAGKEQFNFRVLDDVQLRGRQQPVRIYTIDVDDSDTGENNRIGA